MFSDRNTINSKILLIDVKNRQNLWISIQFVLYLWHNLMLKNIRMGTVVLNQSNFDKSDFELLNASHSPSLIFLEEDVDLGGKTLYFVPGDVLRANGGTLGGNGTLSGIVGIEDTCQQLFQLGADGKCTVTFAEDMVLNVPFLRPEWFGAKGDLVFKYAEKDRNDNDLPPYYIDLIQLDQYNK